VQAHRRYPCEWNGRYRTKRNVVEEDYKMVARGRKQKASLLE
jgi:hypothetical protein